MSQSVIILGANGRFGRAASHAFFKGGWAVRTFTRKPSHSPAEAHFEGRFGNAFDSDALIKATSDCDVIVNALNPPYQNWKRDLPRITEAVIAAAKATGASVLIPGNVYNYGAEMPPILTEDTPHRPSTRKGQLREAMEESYAVAADEGVQTIILRGGDFIEQAKTGNWFDTYVAAKAHQGKLTYPGPLDRVHAWAYLPDMARAMAALAEKRRMLGPFSTFGFEGFNLTGAELVDAIELTLGRSLKVNTMPWPLLRALSPFLPTIREVMEMRYLWQVPHAVCGRSLREALPGYQSTPLQIALKDALGIAQQPAIAQNAFASA
ncbi:MAG: NAD-dependent epimerase/dehydratase family protein [Pseudomonadota bacterium]